MQANLRAKYTFHSNVHYWNGYHKKQRVLPRPLHYHTLHYLTFELHLLHYCFPVQNLFAICLSFTDVILGISNGRKSHRPLKCKTRSVGYFARKQFGPVYIFFLYFNFFFCCHSCSKSAARVTIDIPSVSANSCSALCGAAQWQRMADMFSHVVQFTISRRATSLTWAIHWCCRCSSDILTYTNC